jgi:hypothetical protein
VWFQAGNLVVPGAVVVVMHDGLLYMPTASLSALLLSSASTRGLHFTNGDRKSAIGIETTGFDSLCRADAFTLLRSALPPLILTLVDRVET